MKRFLLSMLAAMALCGTSTAQDLLIRRDGNEQQVKVLEVSDDVIRYKKWSNQDGPTYTVPTADIFMVKYSDGTKDTFAVKKTQERGTDKPQFAPQYEVKALVPDKIRETRLEIGPRIIPGWCVLFVNDAYKASTRYRGDSGFRFCGSLGATVDYYISKYQRNRWFVHGGLEYALRGGNFEDFNIRTDYLNLEFGFGVRGGFGYWIPGFKIGVLTCAKDIFDEEKLNLYSYCNPVTFEIYYQYGICIGQHVDLGFQMGFVTTNITKPELWTGDNTSWNFNFGLMFTYRFKLNAQKTK